MSGWDDRPDLYPGAYPDGTDLEAICDQIASLTGTGWTDYSSTFTITATTTNPTKGSTTYRAAYRRPAGSDLVHVRFYIGIDTGGGFAAGSGDYRFLLPIAAAANSITDQVGFAAITDAGTSLYVGYVSGVDSTHVEIVRHGTGAALGSSGPGTAWATGDIIRGSYTYEAA